MLDKSFTSLDREDERLWSLDSKGQFQLNLFYNVFFDGNMIDIGYKHNSNKLVPRRIQLGGQATKNSDFR